jgi:hypothetical protein
MDIASDDRASNPRRPVLIAGLGLLGLSAAVFLTAVLFAAGAQPVLEELAGTLRGVSVWLLLAGIVVMLLWFILTQLARAPVVKKSESTLFTESTQLGEAPHGGDATNRR